MSRGRWVLGVYVNRRSVVSELTVQLVEAAWASGRRSCWRRRARRARRRPPADQRPGPLWRCFP